VVRPGCGTLGRIDIIRTRNAPYLSSILLEYANVKAETQYLLRRASEEARRAIGSEQPKAAQVHEALSVRYSAKALTLLFEEDEEVIAAQDTAGVG
jgi:hypothetical protein